VSRAALVLGVYALTVALSVGMLASLFVTPIASIGPLGPVYFTGVLVLFVLAFLQSISDPSQEADPVPVPRWLLLAPVVLSVVATGSAVLVAEYEPLVRTVVGGVPFVAPRVGAVSNTALQVGTAVLAFGVVVLVALPLLVRRRAWRTVEAATKGGEQAGVRPSEAHSLLEVVDDPFLADVPNRVAVRTVAASRPAVYVFDDGRRATLAFTEGALDALSEREREAVVARELTRVVERAAVPSFWASALALAVGTAVDPVATEPYDARAGGTVRLPFWFVAPLKVLAAVVLLLLLFVVPVWLLSGFLPVSGPTLVVAYALGTVLVAFGLAKATARVARRVATADVRTADEHGAALADDADALASALRTLRAARSERPRPDDADDVLGALGVLAHCPTDAVALDDRLAALEDVADRLDGHGSD